MHWQKAILSSPSKRAARQNKYAIYVRYPDGSAVVMPKKHSGIRDAKSQEVEGFDDWVSLEEFEAARKSARRFRQIHCEGGESALTVSAAALNCPQIVRNAALERAREINRRVVYVASDSFGIASGQS